MILRKALCACGLLLMACAPTRDPYGLALRQNPEQVPSAVPDSLRADLGITPRKKGAPSFGARFYARPHQQYRMDALGLTSIAASFLWDRGQWALVLHDKREVWTGKGDTLDVKDMPVMVAVEPEAVYCHVSVPSL